MSFRIDRRHWAIAVLLFALNMVGLTLTVRRSLVGVDSRTILLMIACSALISFLTAFILIGLLDAISRRSKSR
jgi:hypothetical protein